MTDVAKKPNRREDDVQVLALAEAQLAALGDAFDADKLQSLQTVVDSYPDAGHDGAGEVAASLLRLLGDLLASGRFDREALAVHIRAWRFMVATQPDAESRAAILEGLRAVSDLYAETRAA